MRRKKQSPTTLIGVVTILLLLAFAYWLKIRKARLTAEAETEMSADATKPGDVIIPPDTPDEQQKPAALPPAVSMDPTIEKTILTEGVATQEPDQQQSKPMPDAIIEEESDVSPGESALTPEQQQEAEENAAADELRKVLAQYPKEQQQKILQEVIAREDLRFICKNLKDLLNELGVDNEDGPEAEHHP